MKYVRIIKATFLQGAVVHPGEEYEVDDRTAIMLGSKAVVIEGPGGAEKLPEDGVMESFPVVRQQEMVVIPVEKKVAGKEKEVVKGKGKAVGKRGKVKGGKK